MFSIRKRGDRRDLRCISSAFRVRSRPEVWYLETITGSDDLPIHPMMLRLFRLVKLSRVVRLVRILEKYDALYLMVASIRGSVMALAWSTILLLVVQMMLSLFMTTILEAYFLNDSWPGDKMEVGLGTST